ncbi:MAG: hypothetical protein EBS01_02570 [Verrucomicrobia bacterium]|nr:hypothetical protein [Verrucomicrobiota bacterium]
MLPCDSALRTMDKESPLCSAAAAWVSLSDFRCLASLRPISLACSEGESEAVTRTELLGFERFQVDFDLAAHWRDEFPGSLDPP